MSTFLAPTLLLAALLAALIFAVRSIRRVTISPPHPSRESSGSEQAFMARAMQEAVTRLRDKEQAQQARADQSERLSDDIVHGLSAGLLVISASGLARVVNPAARRLLGLSAFDVPVACETLLSSVPAISRVIAEALASRESIVRRAVDLRPLSLSSGVSHIDVTISPIAGTDGMFDGVICLLNDLSTVIQLEDQLRLRESLAQVGEMTAGIAHEFRNSLATIHGYARLIDTSSLSERDRSCVEGIRAETTKLGEVTTNFLQFARPVEMARERVDVRNLLHRVADEVRGDVESAGGRLTVDAELAAVVEGDEVMLRQAFSNLCRNAIEACHAQTSPVLALELVLSATRREAIVRVRDNGPGIALAVRERIFQPFFTTKASGTGLGLSLVQKIVVTHNGRIVPTHPASGGLCMEVVLPLADSSIASLRSR